MPAFQPLQHEGNSVTGTAAATMSAILSFLVALWGSVTSMFTGMRPAPEVKVNNRKFTVVKQLGEGGFSFVFLVKESTPTTHTPNERYALKRIRIQLPEQEERLKHEIAAHKAVNSPHVVKLLESQVVRERPNGPAVEGLLLLPFFGNGTVQDMIDANPPGSFIPLKTILTITIGVCKGLKAFHSHNPPLAFRDLKPANVLVDDSGQGVLMDLGSVAPARVKITSRREAVELQDLCAETVTAPFRAPELFDPPSQADIDERTDVWALGCTMYAMAYGQSPFDGSMTAAVGGKVIFPNKNDPYGPHFRPLLQWIIVTDRATRPTVDAVEQRCAAMMEGIEFQV